jgi:hypothetical protein
MPRPTPGIRTRHHRQCPSRQGGACGKPCKPSYEAWVWSVRDGKKIYRTFSNHSEAKGGAVTRPLPSGRASCERRRR